MKKIAPCHRGLSLFLALLIILGAHLPLSAQTPGEVGRVEEVQGAAWVTPQDGGRPQEAVADLKINQGDTIETRRWAKLRIRLVDESSVSLAGNTRLTIDQYVFDPAGGLRSSALSLLWGKMRCIVNDLTGYRQKKFQVTTTTAIVGVRGTDFLVWAKTKEHTQVASFVNAVDVAGVVDPTKSILLEPGNMIQVMLGLPPSAPVKITPAIMKDLLEELLPSDAIPPDIPPAGQSPSVPGPGKAAAAATDAAGAAVSTTVDAVGGAANAATDAAGAAASSAVGAVGGATDAAGAAKGVLGTGKGDR